jgi:hypothetical protein
MGMGIRRFVVGGAVSWALAAGAAQAQTVGDEIVLPAGMFAKDATGIVLESGGYGGTGVQHGTFKFPDNSGAVVVGITTLLPASWVGHEVEIVFGGSAGALFGGKFRIHGIVDNSTFGLTATLISEDWGNSEVVVLGHHVVASRRFGIAIGRDSNHVGDPSTLTMNFEYLALRLVS